ncbi:MAG: DUF3619 family protein [bacterium]
MRLADTELQKKVVAALDANSQQLDYRVTNKLAQARRQALQQTKTAQSSPFWRQWITQHLWQTAAVSALTLVLSVVVVHYVTLDQSSTHSPQIVENDSLLPQGDVAFNKVEFEALKNGEDLDLFENMDLYQWLDAEFG